MIEVESMVSAGTTFHLYLPALQDAAAVLFEKDDAFCPEESPGQGTILIMDDEDSIREVASAVLLKTGYGIVEVRNGDEAIDCLKAALHSGTPFIGAILDLSIPGGRGGAETIHDLRLIDPDLAVIASSGYSDHPIMANPGEYGFNGSLPKPYHANELIDKVRIYFKAREINPAER
jgi:CheY-like chemotaxis protein